MASQTYQRAAGADFDSLVVGNVLQMRSLGVTNPTGAWLWFEPTNEFIPPYTLGWARTLTPNASRVTLRWRATGPDGTASVYLGDLATVIVYDDASAGVSNGQQFIPITRRRIVAGTMPVAASLTNIAFIGGDTGRYIRSILIDNKSQNWLQLGTYLDTIPPNTVGWGKILPDAPLSITITAMAVGPDGSASVALGDVPSLTILDDLSAGNASGVPYVPIPHKRIVTTAAFANLGVTAFAGADTGRLVRGILIDNPSGAWLTLTIGGAAYRIAPYQLRWVKRIDPATLNVTSLTFDAAGPAGQVSTRQGDQVTLTLLDQIPDVADTSFIQGFTPVLIATNAIQQVQTTIGLAGVLIAAIANKRIRLLTLNARLGYSIIVGIAPTCGVSFVVQDNSGSGQALVGHLSPYLPAISQTYPEGVAFAVGASINFSAASTFADQLLLIAITYQVV